LKAANAIIISAVVSFLGLLALVVTAVVVTFVVSNNMRRQEDALKAKKNSSCRK